MTRANEMLVEVQIGGKVLRVDLNHYTEAPDSYSFTVNGALIVGHEDKGRVLAEFREQFDELFAGVEGER